MRSSPPFRVGDASSRLDVVRCCCCLPSAFLPPRSILGKFLTPETAKREGDEIPVQIGLNLAFSHLPGRHCINAWGKSRESPRPRVPSDDVTEQMLLPTCGRSPTVLILPRRTRPLRHRGALRRRMGAQPGPLATAAGGSASAAAGVPLARRHLSRGELRPRRRRQRRSLPRRPGRRGHPAGAVLRASQRITLQMMG